MERAKSVKEELKKDLKEGDETWEDAEKEGFHFRRFDDLKSDSLWDMWVTHWSFALKSDFDHARSISEVILDSWDLCTCSTNHWTFCPFSYIFAWLSPLFLYVSIACQFPAVSWGSPTQQEQGMSLAHQICIKKSTWNDMKWQYNGAHTVFWNFMSFPAFSSYQALCYSVSWLGTWHPLILSCFIGSEGPVHI